MGWESCNGPESFCIFCNPFPIIYGLLGEPARRIVMLFHSVYLSVNSCIKYTYNTCTRRHRAQIFEKVGVKLYHILLWTKWLERNSVLFSDILFSVKTSVFLLFRENSSKILKMLKCLFHPACLARVISWIAFATNKGQPRDDTFNECSL